MAFWQEILIMILATALTVLAVLAGFYRFVLRPYLDRKVAELKAAGDDVEGRVANGIRAGVTQALMDLPESTLKESTRTFLKFGSGLMENGLSNFLGSQAEPGDHSRRPDQSHQSTARRRSADPDAGPHRSDNR